MKSHFKTACIVQVSDRSGMFELVQDLVYYSARLGRDIVVPAGFGTDFASIPRVFHSIIKVNGRHRKSAVLHDYLCEHGADEGLTQRESDLVFNEACEADDVRLTQRTVMFGMVRLYQSIKGVFRG